jgi:hypothetical protein
VEWTIAIVPSWRGCRSEIEQLERTVANLSPKDLAQFRAWFLELDESVWDQQIEVDFKTGKLDTLPAEACDESKQRKDRHL